MSSVLFAPPRTIRKVKSSDLEAMKKALSQGPPDKHAARYARQEQGECVYLIAEQEGTPVAHLLLKWGGAGGDSPASSLEGVPDVEDLFVDPAHRRRHVATRLMDEAERLAADRGYRSIGLSCGVDNEAARALYAKRGYRDADLGTFRLAGSWTDPETGEIRSWEEQCVYLVRDLGAGDEKATGDATAVSETTEQTDAGGNPMTDNGTEAGKKEESAAAAETPVQAETAAEEKPLADRVVDFAFGVALSAAETLEKVVNQAVEVAKDAPTFFEQMQERGRPAREKLVRDLRGDVLKPARDAAETVADVATAGRANFKTAEDEIRALEERVKTLEREVVARTTVESPSGDPGPFVPDDSPSDARVLELEATEVAETVAETPPVAEPDAVPADDAPYAIAAPPAEELSAESASALDVETGEVTPASEKAAPAKKAAKPAAPKSPPKARPARKPDGEDETDKGDGAA